MVNSYIPKVSESDVSKGVSSLSTPTSREIADRLNKSRSRSSSSKKKKNVISVGLTTDNKVVAPKSTSVIKRGTKKVTQSTYKVGGKTYFSEDGKIVGIKSRSGFFQRVRSDKPTRFNYYDVNPQSIDPKKLTSRTTTLLKDNNGNVWGYYDKLRGVSIGFSNPIKERDVLRLEQSRQPVLKQIGTVIPAPKTTISKVDNAINNAIKNRSENSRLASIYKSRGQPVKSVEAGFNVFVYTFIERALKSGRGLAYLPATIKQISKNPSLLKSLPRQIMNIPRDYAGVLKSVTPLEAIAIVGSDLLILRGTNVAIKEVSKLSSNAITRLNPKFVGTGRVGSVLEIKLPKGKVVKLRIVSKMPKESIKKQISRAGTVSDTAVSSQADRLISLVKSSKVVRKPIPNENFFTQTTKNLLKRFDSGKLTKKQIYALDKRIRGYESKRLIKKGIIKSPVKGLLERSGFIDPTGNIRPSRLGIVRNVNKWKDYFSSNITFKKQKPQILLFSDLKVANFPKYLSSIKKKLANKVSLSNKESELLLNWMFSKPGEVKPLGFVSRESELIIPPGSLIKRVKKVGVTIIDGKKVPIVQVKVVKPSSSLKSLLSKWERGSISSSESSILKSRLKKETGFNYGLSYSPSVNARYVSIKRLLASGSFKSISKNRVYSKGVSVRSRKSKIVSRPKSVVRSPKSKKITKSVKSKVISRPKSVVRRPKSKSVSSSSRSNSLSKISSIYSPRTASKLNSIYQNSRKRSRTKFSKDEVKYMLSKIYVKGRYRPSLAAIVFNITGFKAPKSLTGFEIRPIIKPRRSVSKKKS